MKEQKIEKLDDLRDVELPEQGWMKFVVLEIRKDNETKQVLVGDPRYSYHRYIVSDYRAKLPSEMRTEVCGGGRISIDEQKVYAYGHSGDYGEAAQDVVERLLKQYIAENKLTQELKVEMGVGY